MFLGYSLGDYRDYGIRRPVCLDVEKKPSALLTGKSGSGKSLSALYYLENLLRTGESRVFVSDYKGGSEYQALEGSHSYASGAAAIGMIRDFHAFYSAVREARLRLKQHYTLFIEEWMGLLTYAETQDKKLKAELQAKVGELLAVSRGLNMGVFLTVQRADASLFSSGTREQFQCICSFGRLSQEQARMLGFSEYADEIDLHKNYPAGQGIALIDGQEGPVEIMVPYVKNPEVLCSNIRKCLNRQLALPELTRAVAEGRGAGL